MRITLRYIVEDVDRHGNVRVYFRRVQRRADGTRAVTKIRLTDPVGSPVFMARYEALLAETATDPSAPPPEPSLDARPPRGSWRALCLAYMASPAFRVLDPGTRRTRQLILEHTWAERLNPSTDRLFANFPVTAITTKVLRVLRDRKAGPAAGNNRVRAFRAVLRWAHGEEIIATDPSRDLARNALPGDGWHTWTPDEIARFEARHPVGTKARLALALLMYTGARRSDVVRLGRQHERDGCLVFRPWKGRARASAALVSMPISAELAAVLAAGPAGDMTYLVTAYGRPFTAAGFGAWFRDRCDEAGLAHCSAHGVRKAAATRAAEAGATAHQLMAMFGWLKIDEAELYTRAADRRRLAAEAAPLLSWPRSVGHSRAEPPGKQRGKP